MSLSSSSVSRSTPPAERSSQRSERAPAGDFAALLDLVPTPARAPVARAAERRDAGSHASAERDERPEPASPRSRHSRPAPGRPGAASSRDAAPSERSRGRSTGSDAAAAAGSSPGEALPATAASTAETAPTASPAPLAPAPPAESPAALVGAESLGVPVPALAAGQPPTAGEGAPSTVAAPALPFAPAGLPLGSVPAGAGAPAEAAGVPADGTPVTAETAVHLPVAAGAPVAAPDVAPGAGAPVAAAEPAVPANAEAVPAGDVALPEADAAPAQGLGPEAGAGAAGEPATAPPTGTGTGAGAGSSGAHDGHTPAAPSTEEVSELPAGAPAPSSPAAPASLPGAGRAPDVVPFGSERAVPLERAPRAVAQLLHVASQSGVSHARIALRPVELGGIEIFLQVSPAGLAAQLVADSPEAARMLAQATEDLRRSLAGQNVELISIDVSTSAEQQQRDDLASSGFLAEHRTPDGRLMPRRADGAPAPTPETPEPTTPTVIELPDGLLVDVLA